MPAPTLFSAPVILNSNSNGFTNTGDQFYSHVAVNGQGQIAVIWNNATAYEWSVFDSSGTGNAIAVNAIASNTIVPTTGFADVTDTASGGFVFAYVTGQNTTGAAEANYFTWNNGHNSTTTTLALTDDQTQLSLTRMGNGGFLLSGVTNIGGTNQDIYRLTSVDGSGSQTYGSGQITSAGAAVVGTQDRPASALLASGSEVVVWLDRNDNTIHSTDIESDGSRDTSNHLLASEAALSAAANQSNNISVSGLADGGYVTSWGQNASTTRFMIADADGTVRVAATTASVSGYAPSVLGLADGRFVLVNTNSSTIHGQIYSAAGVADGATFDIATGSAVYNPHLALMPDGRFVVTFSSNSLPGGAASDIGMAIYDPRQAAVHVAGTTLADQYYGSAYNDTFDGGNGNDTLFGGAGHDLIYGGAGSDSLVGDAGNDTLSGGFGSDLLYGQDGSDNLYGEDSNDSLFGGADNDQLVGGFGDDALYGGDGNDTVFGEVGNDQLVGGAGNDVQYGQDGTDVLFGEAGDDQLIAGNGDDRLYGQDGNDMLKGEAGADLLDGGNGNDFLIGGAGIDQLTGGAGADVFYYDTPLEPADFVTDFSHAESDRLVFLGSAFNIPAGFTLTAGVGLLQGAGAHPVAATATFYYDTTSKALWFDADGTGASDAHVIAFLTNTPTLHVEDFLFV